MATSTVKYLGDLQTECVHLKSGQKFVTDAPVDNNGKGSAFSPTDLLATSYASCMITIIGIYCNNNNIEFNHAEADVIKSMESNPRRVGKIEINLNLEGNNWDTQQQAKIIKAAEACPVAKSVNESMEIEISYTF